MKLAAPKYTRDFYPEEMLRREWIEQAWHEASRAAGFLPWDGPILETLDLYKRKSGEEIVGQLFNIDSKGNQELAVRPEMTPSLARMIVNKQSSLPRPIKWYTIGRMCRYERGQRGRLREFWQWNVDVLGVEGPVADAEIISVALDGLARLGLSPNDLAVHINSRQLLAALLLAAGIPDEQHPALYAVIDKRGKLPPAEIDKLFQKIGLSDSQLDRVRELMSVSGREEVQALAERWKDPRAMEQVAELNRLFELLDALGKGAYCRFDVGIVRGLAYYTGPVFEIFDTKGELRALCGGGRYDQLMETMGGQPMPACGFGMGDVVLGELLAERKLGPATVQGLDAYVIPLSAEAMVTALKVVAYLRQKGERVDFSPKPGPRDKLLKRAVDAKARFAYLVSGESGSGVGSTIRRNLSTREEETIGIEVL